MNHVPHEWERVLIYKEEEDYYKALIATMKCHSQEEWTELINRIKNPTEEKSLEENLLFSVHQRFQKELDKGFITKGLRQEFLNNKIEFSQNANALVENTGNKWQIKDG